MQCSRYLYIFGKLNRPTTPIGIRIRLASNVNAVKKALKELQQTASEVDVKNDVVVKTARVSYSLNHSRAIEKYFETKKFIAEIKSKIPEQLFLRKYKNPNCLYLLDYDVAGKIFKTILPFLKSSKGHILEINAGVGALTTYLLNANIERLRIYEADSLLHKELQVLLLKKKSDASLFRANLLTLWAMIKTDRDDNQNRVGTVFDGLTSLSWEDEPAVKMILALSTDSFILHIMFSIIFQSGICVYGRPQLFAIMLPRVYHKLTATPDDPYSMYLSKSVMFQILFEHKILLELIPEKSFIPWMRKPKNAISNKELEFINKDVVYLVNITARQDLFERIPPDMLKLLWFFVQVLFQKRKAKLITCLEKWIPGCGIRLIAMGHTIYTECGKLTPEQILKLFLEFTSWPEFESSSFISSMESVLIKMSDPGMAEEIRVDKTKNYEAKTLDVECENIDELDDDDMQDEQSDSILMNGQDKIR